MKFNKIRRIKYYIENSKIPISNFNNNKKKLFVLYKQFKEMKDFCYFEKPFHFRFGLKGDGIRIVLN